MKTLEDILTELVANTGEEYHQLHSGNIDFETADARMKYYENKAAKEIRKLDFKQDDYQKGYKVGYEKGLTKGVRGSI